MSRVKIVKKPWGWEVWYARTPKYAGKVLTIEKGGRLSLQYHRVKHETIYVLKGRLLLELDRRRIVLKAGSAYAIRPKSIHRFSAPDGRVTLLEASTPELADVVRLEDDYGRAKL